MLTERLKTDGDCYRKTVNRAAELLMRGGTVAIPTETVYGLAASAYDAEAVKRVFEAKGRPQDNPLIVHIAELHELEEVARDIPECAYECARRFWPGPFTMILKRNPKIPACVSAGLDTVAVRMPSHKTARDIIAAGVPLAAPSANTSGKPSPTTAECVLEDLDGKINAVVMDEECEVGVESTVITLVTSPPRILRPGAVTPEALLEVLPEIMLDEAVLKMPKPDESVSSPGMKYKHYAPKTPVILVEGTGDFFAGLVNGKKNCAAVCFAEERNKITVPAICYGTERDEKTLAHSVFSVLREADGLAANEIYVHAPQKSGIGLAVYNRLIRAAAFRVIKQ